MVSLDSLFNKRIASIIFSDPCCFSLNKYCWLQTTYGRFSSSSNGYRDLDIFIQQKDNTKIVDPERQKELSSKLKYEMLHPLRVIISNRGPDTELLVANPVEFCGEGRPRVFYDVTLALKLLGICIFLVRPSYQTFQTNTHDCLLLSKYTDGCMLMM